MGFAEPFFQFREAGLQVAGFGSRFAFTAFAEADDLDRTGDGIGDFGQGFLLVLAVEAPIRARAEQNPADGAASTAAVRVEADAQREERIGLVAIERPSL